MPLGAFDLVAFAGTIRRRQGPLTPSALGALNVIAQGIDAIVAETKLLFAQPRAKTALIQTKAISSNSVDNLLFASEHGME